MFSLIINLIPVEVIIWAVVLDSKDATGSLISELIIFTGLNLTDCLLIELSRSSKDTMVSYVII